MNEAALHSVKSASGTLAHQLFDVHSEALFCHRVGLVAYQALLDYLTSTKGKPTDEDLKNEVVYEQGVNPFTPYSLRNGGAPSVSSTEIRDSLQQPDIDEFQKSAKFPTIDHDSDLNVARDVVDRLVRYATSYQQGMSIFIEI